MKLSGILLVLYGFASDPEIYDRSLGINVNLVWGVLVLVFGLAMLYFGDKRIRQ